MGGEASIEWFGIMRHAQAYRSHLGDDEVGRGPEGLSRTGVCEAEVVGDRLAETVLSLDKDGSHWTAADILVLHAATEVARETAELVALGINEHWAALVASHVRPNAPEGAEVLMIEMAALHPDVEQLRSSKLAETWRQISSQTHPGARAVLIVGHDPQVTRLLHEELAADRRLTRRLAGRTALDRGEVAMVRRRARGAELMWVISPDAEKAIEQLQQKIKSKMETAKVLGAFLTALIFFAAKELSARQDRSDWYPWVAGAGVGLLAFATGAFVVTMFLYDGLLMPVRYWAPMPDEETWLARRRWYRLFGTGQDPRRPPSSAATVMFHGMQRVWSALFVPAAIAAGLGTAATAVALAKPEGGWWYALIASAVGVAGVLGLLALAGRPQLGTTD
jgi:phosphohistidine phosphatase SixA